MRQDEQGSWNEMNAKLRLITVCLLSLSAVISGCEPGQTSNPTLASTPAPTPTRAPTATSTVTPTTAPPPTPTPPPLECQIIKTEGQKEAGAYAFNIYALVIESFPSPSSSAPVEIEVLQVDIPGESGEADRDQGNTQELGPDWTTMIVTINDARTFTESQNSYKVHGFIIYNLAQFGAIAEYFITVSGGIFGLKSQSCSGKI